MAIVQWNSNSFHANLEEIQMLVTTQQPDILCIQETKFKVNQKSNLKNYHFYRNDRDHIIASRGVAILVHNSTQIKQITLNTTIEAIAIETSYPEKMALCNIYIPPNQNPSETELRQITQQLAELSGYRILY